MALSHSEPLSWEIYWEIYKALSAETFHAARKQGISPIQAQLLHNRGIQTFSAMRAFLDADYARTLDPDTLIDLPRATTRIQKALGQREHITVYGDYDADGVTSSALLFRALRILKQPEATLDFHIPNRLRDGCGLNLRALDLLKARGTQLIITTDCGSSDVTQVEYARTLGIDIIITDHHHPPDELPQAYAMINPWRSESVYGERYLCGVGVAFKLTQALYRAYKRTTEEELELLDLVAIGTIADVAPLLGENHTLVRLGLQRLNTTTKPGLRALIQNANLQPGKIRERDIAFGLAPRINAAGRMKEASIAFELLVSDQPEEANAYVAELEQLNQNRQQETEELMRNVRAQAAQQPEKPVILVNGDNWHEGIIGLVAGKLAEEINKPVLVLSNDLETRLSRGSARSQKGYNIIAALHTFQGLERYGGHAQAAGFTIRSEDIARLHEHLIRWREQGSNGEPAAQEIRAISEGTDGSDLPDTGEQTTSTNNASKIDVTFTSLEKVNYKLYKEIRALGPFGSANPEPIFKLEGLRLLDTWFSGFNKQNLRLRLGSAQGQTQQIGTFTRGAARNEALAGVSRVDIIFRIESSEDTHKQEIWLKILHVVPTQEK